MPKSATLSGIKSLHTYTIQEAAGITGVSERTIREWIKQGLAAMAYERPTLVRGDAMIAFIKNQRSSRKKRVPQNAFYCLKCRAPRKPAGGFVDCQVNGNRTKLIGMCEVCETLMHKAIAMDQISDIKRHFEVSVSETCQETSIHKTPQAP